MKKLEIRSAFPNEREIIDLKTIYYLNKTTLKLEDLNLVNLNNRKKNGEDDVLYFRKNIKNNSCELFDGSNDIFNYKFELIEEETLKQLVVNCDFSLQSHQEFFCKYLNNIHKNKLEEFVDFSVKHEILRLGKVKLINLSFHEKETTTVMKNINQKINFLVVKSLEHGQVFDFDGHHDMTGVCLMEFNLLKRLFDLFDKDSHEVFFELQRLVYDVFPNLEFKYRDCSYDTMNYIGNFLINCVKNNEIKKIIVAG